MKMNMDMFTLKLDKNISLEKSNAEYINPCCTNCDVILNLVKPQIQNLFPNSNLEIDQEDWGWYLIFNKDEFVYNLHLSFYDELSSADEYLFYSFVKKKTKKFLVTIKSDDVEESNKFQELIKPIFSNLGLVSLNN